MKKFIIHTLVCIGTAFLLCASGILLSSTGRDKMLLSMEHPLPSESLETEQGNVASSDTQSETETNSEPIAPVPDVPPVDISQIEVDTENEGSEDEYSLFAIANQNVSPFVNVRQGASTEDEVIGRMYPGSVASIIEYVGSGDNLWLKMRSGNVEGYIKSDYFTYGKDALTVIDNYVAEIALVKVDILHVRTGPGTDFDFAGYLVKGENVPILEHEGNWVRVQYAGSEDAYICADYVNIIEDYVTAKSNEEISSQEQHSKELLERLQKENAPSESTGSSGNGNGSSNNNGTNGGNTTQPNPTPTPTPTPDPTPTPNPTPDPTPTPVPPTNDTLDAKRQAVVNYALQYIGYPYVNGGQSLATGTDCSGFTMYVYQAFGYYISRTPGGQLSSAGISVSRNELLPGDIVCYQVYEGGGCSHVGMYIGDGKIIHAANPRKGVLIAGIDIHNILGYKRIIY